MQAHPLPHGSNSQGKVATTASLPPKPLPASHCCDNPYGRFFTKDKTFAQLVAQQRAPKEE